MELERGSASPEHSAVEHRVARLQDRESSQGKAAQLIKRLGQSSASGGSGRAFAARLSGFVAGLEGSLRQARLFRSDSFSAMRSTIPKSARAG